MSAGWLVYALAAGALVAVVCWAAEGLARTHRQPRRWIWTLGLGALLVVALRGLLLATAPGPQAVMLPKTDVGARAVDDVAAGALSQVVSLVQGVVTRAMGDAITAGARALPAPIGEGAVVLWLVASVAVLTIIVLVHLRIARARRRWPAAELHGHGVRIAPSVGPAVLGIARPVIVVPRWLLARPEDEQRLVLVHEAEHVRARDHLVLAGAWILVALIPWHPAAWWMLSRLRLAIELDCDARVLGRGVQPLVYGTLLIDLAGQCSASPVGATALADESTHLERRLLAMKPITSRFPHLRAATLMAAGSLALLAACEATVPTAADIQGMDVAAAERTAAQSRMLDKEHLADMTFFVDGRKVDAEAAHAITPNQIASVTVEKTAAGTATVRITTNGQPADASVTGGAHHSGSALARLHGTLQSAVGGSASAAKVHGPGHERGTMAGLILVDGVRVDASAFHRLDPSGFASVEVIKGPEATKLYSDPAAANGVIKVTTRKR